jgi:hypothetical protein
VPVSSAEIDSTTYCCHTKTHVKPTRAFISLSIRVGKPEARNVSTNACRRADRLPSGSPTVVGCWGWRDCQLG